jgi:hypothetical protein
VYLLHPLALVATTYGYAELLKTCFTATTTLHILFGNSTVYPPVPLDLFPGFWYGAHYAAVTQGLVPFNLPGVSTTPLVTTRTDLIVGQVWTTTEVASGLPWLGFVLVGIVVQPPLWAFAYGLTKLPLVKEVL